MHTERSVVRASADTISAKLLAAVEVRTTARGGRGIFGSVSGRQRRRETDALNAMNMKNLCTSGCRPMRK